MKNRSILIFTGFFIPHLGGIEKYVDNFSKELVKNGYKVVIVTTNYDNSSDNIIDGERRILKLPTYNIFKQRYPIIRKNKEYKKIINILNDISFDAIIVNTRFHLTSHIGANYGKKRNIPVYLIEHGSNYVSVNSKFWDFFANIYENFLTWKIKKSIKGFYGVSNACNQWLEKLNVNPSGVWYNAIDSNQFFPLKKKTNRINFIFAGRVLQEKGVRYLLLAFSELEKKYDNIHLYIAGDGNELNNYKKQFKSKNIEFLGKLEHDKLFEYYAQSDIFVFPSLYPEGLPTCILEAGLMKLCVITTECGGSTEVVKDKKNGLIIEKNVESLQKAMESLITNKKMIENYGEKLYITVKKYFCWNECTKKMIKDIYNGK